MHCLLKARERQDFNTNDHSKYVPYESLCSLMGALTGGLVHV